MNGRQISVALTGLGVATLAIIDIEHTRADNARLPRPKPLEVSAPSAPDLDFQAARGAADLQG